MGYGYTFRCNKCGNEQSFLTGNGMRFFEEVNEIEKEILSGKYGEETKVFINRLQKLDEGEKEFFWIRNLRYEIYRCRKCHSADSKLYFRFGECTPVYKCQYCQEQKLAKVNLYRPFLIKCEKCGAQGLFKKNERFLWD